MSFRRKRRFAEVVESQLEMFAADHSGDLEEIAGALDGYNRAPAEEAEERYSEYADLVESISDDLDEVRAHYAVTLEEESGAEYMAVFAKKARQRFRHIPLELE